MSGGVFNITVDDCVFGTDGSDFAGVILALFLCLSPCRSTGSSQIQLLLLNATPSVDETLLCLIRCISRRLVDGVAVFTMYMC